MDRDQLFWKFILGMFIIMALFGAGMTLATIVNNQTVALRWLSAFSAMFTGVLGLGSGYLLGKSNGNGKDK